MLPRGKQSTLFLQPLGTFSEDQRKIISLTADFMNIFFNLPVQMMKQIPIMLIPPNKQRRNPHKGEYQLLTRYILDELLKKQKPKTAVAYVAFTASDLWPGKGWNFVFGQASLIYGVGVWSIYRYGNPSRSEKDFLLVLKRTLKTGVHETGHIFSMNHCIEYACLMNGSNSLAESDRRPLMCCPECMAKICYATKTNPLERYEKLLNFFEDNGLNDEAKIIYESIKKLTKI